MNLSLFPFNSISFSHFILFSSLSLFPHTLTLPFNHPSSIIHESIDQSISESIAFSIYFTLSFVISFPAQLAFLFIIYLSINLSFFFYFIIFLLFSPTLRLTLPPACVIPFPCIPYARHISAAHARVSPLNCYESSKHH